MPTNRNEAVWKSGSILHTGGGNDALVMVPSDIDVIDVSVIVAAATTAQVEVTHDSLQEISGINERPLRYPQAAINDLGGSGELRMNAASGADFTDDGWAVGDTFEVISHKVPDFGPEGTPPTTLGDGQVYTVTSVAADVLGFSEDPGITLAEGDIVVALSRAAVAQDSLNWAKVNGDIAADTTAHINLGSAGQAVRVIASAGTGDITYEFRGRHQSVVRPAPFVANVESRPYAGIDASRVGLTLPSVPDDSVVVWDEVVTAGPNASRRQARATVSSATFIADGVQAFDRLFFGGHSVTGNGGQYVVDSVAQGAVTFKEPLRGSAGTDTPGRVKLRHWEATRAALPGDFIELMLEDGANSIFAMQDATDTPLFDSGPDLVADMSAGTPTAQVAGPWPDSMARGNNAGWADDYISVNPDYGMGASTEGTVELWVRQDARVGGQSSFSILGGGNFITIQHSASSGLIDAQFVGPDLADPGAWVASTAYAQGDRVRPVADDGSLIECEIAGTSAAGEPTWPIKGSTVVDNDITWRHVTSRSIFHDIIASADFDMSGNTALVDDEWTHLAQVRSTLGYHYYVNGVLVDEVLIPADDTVPGTFGTPKRLDFSVDYTATSFLIGSQGGTSFNFEGDIAYLSTYSVALTAAQLLAHYDAGVALGL